MRVRLQVKCSSFNHLGTFYLNYRRTRLVRTAGAISSHTTNLEKAEGEFWVEITPITAVQVCPLCSLIMSASKIGCPRRLPILELKSAAQVYNLCSLTTSASMIGCPRWLPKLIFSPTAQVCAPCPLPTSAPEKTKAAHNRTQLCCVSPLTISPDFDLYTSMSPKLGFVCLNLGFRLPSAAASNLYSRQLNL